jgi:hypothetical protein
MQWHKAPAAKYNSIGHSLIIPVLVCQVLLFWPLWASAQNIKSGALPAGTRIKIQITRSVISGRVRIGDYIPFKVFEEVRMPGFTQPVIAKDTVVIGRVVDRKHKFMVFKKGMVGIAIDSIRATDGTTVSVYVTRPNSDLICNDKISRNKRNPENEKGVVQCIRGRVYAGTFISSLPSAVVSAGATTALVLIKDSTAKAAAAVTLASQVASQPGLNLLLNGADAEIDNGEIFDAVVKQP